MTSPSVKIVGLTLVGEPSADGQMDVLASFSCELGGIVRLDCCHLVRFSNNGAVRAFPPRGASRRAGEHVVHILDSGMRDAITTAAHRAFLALEGVTRTAYPPAEVAG